MSPCMSRLGESHPPERELEVLHCFTYTSTASATQNAPKSHQFNCQHYTLRTTRYNCHTDFHSHISYHKKHTQHKIVIMSTNSHEIPNPTVPNTNPLISLIKNLKFHGKRTSQAYNLTKSIQFQFSSPNLD